MKRILVIGDAILDKYWFGDSSRLSPEAPVPVVNIEKIDIRLGGAANVANNISSIGVPVAFVSAIGDDEAGSEIINLLEGKNITPFLYHSNNYKTIVKLRILARNQQVCRCDFETKVPETALVEIKKNIPCIISDYDIIIFSDYAKGFLKDIKELMRCANDLGKTIIVDPKSPDFSQYEGATIITPNKKELAQVIGPWFSENQLNEKVLNLIEKHNIKNLLLTRSEEGMSLFTQEDRFDFPVETKEVFDVSGAGDTVVAILAAMLSKNADLITSVKIANRAAGIVVGKIGTATLTQAEFSSIFN